jgi:hypothetical protein
VVKNEKVPILENGISALRVIQTGRLDKQYFAVAKDATLRSRYGMAVQYADIERQRLKGYA